MLEPGQFTINEAWVAFQLNGAPIRTEQDGAFNCIALMDAASCFILDTAFVPEDAAEPSELEVRRLFKSGWARYRQYPARLLVPEGQFQTSLTEAAARHGIAVVAVPDAGLWAFTGEARQGFREHVQDRGD